MEKIRLFIGTPAYKWPVDPHFANSVAAIMADQRFDCEFRAVIGDALVERARAAVLAEYLEYKKPWQFFLNIDWDIEFRPDDVYRACMRDLPVLGGPYTFKSHVEGKKHGIVFRAAKGAKPTENFLIQAQYLGGGFTLVRDDVIQHLCLAYDELRFRENPDMHDPPRTTYDLWRCITVDRPDWGEDERELLSEDYAFCERIGALGYKMYLDLSVILKHWDGDKCYDLPTAEQPNSDSTTSSNG